jgi:hypothetical protein
MANIQSYIDMATTQANEARAANLKRYDEMMGIYNQIAEQYSPTGTFGAGYKAELEATKKRDVASATSQSIESGLYGTSIPATAGAKWEETVGAPARLKLEDIRTERYAGALEKKAGAVERREDTYPDYSQIAQMLMQASARPTTTTPTGLDAFGRPMDGYTPAQPSYAQPSTQPSYYGGYSAPSYASYLAPTAKKAATTPTATPAMYGAATAAQQWLAEPIGYQEGGGGYYGGYEEPTTYSGYLKKYAKAASLPGYGTTAGQWEL